MDTSIFIKDFVDFLYRKKNEMEKRKKKYYWYQNSTDGMHAEKNLSAASDFLHSGLVFRGRWQVPQPENIRLEEKQNKWHDLNICCLQTVSVINLKSFLSLILWFFLYIYREAFLPIGQFTHANPFQIGWLLHACFSVYSNLFIGLVRNVLKGALKMS